MPSNFHTSSFCSWQTRFALLNLLPMQVMLQDIKDSKRINSVLLQNEIKTCFGSCAALHVKINEKVAKAMCSRRRKILSKAMELDWAACLHLYTLHLRISRQPTSQSYQQPSRTKTLRPHCPFQTAVPNSIIEGQRWQIQLHRACSKHTPWQDQASQTLDELAEVRCTR